MEFGYLKYQKFEEKYQKQRDKLIIQQLQPHFDQFRDFYNLKKEIQNTLCKNNLQDYEKSILLTTMLSDRNYDVMKSKKINKIKLFGNIELNVGNVCSLQCRYCYLDNFGIKQQDNINQKLYPISIEVENNSSVHINNILQLVNFLQQNNFTPYQLEIFGGEQFFKQVGKKLLNTLYNFYQNVQYEYRPQEIIVPTNMTWIINDKLQQEIKEYIQKFREIGIYIGLSQSVDGLLDNLNRPWINKKMYKQYQKQDEKYYDKIFKFQQEMWIGFHPMIYSTGIEYWVDNFLWFIKMFQKYNLIDTSKKETLDEYVQMPLYLLEVRNPEWKLEHMIEFQYFIRFLILFTQIYYQKIVKREEKIRLNDIVKFIYTRQSFNILSNSFSKTQRGIGCSLQTVLMINTQDLSIQQCHRHNYQQLKQQSFEIKDNKLEVKQYSPENYIQLKMFHSETMHLCSTCQINYQCQKYCPQQHLEQHKEIFTPVPTVCQLEHIKAFQILLTYKDLGLLSQFLNILDQDQKYSQLLMLDLIQKNKELQEQLRKRDKIYINKINTLLDKFLDGTIKNEPIYTEYEREIQLKNQVEG